MGISTKLLEMYCLHEHFFCDLFFGARYQLHSHMYVLFLNKTISHGHDNNFIMLLKILFYIIFEEKGCDTIPCFNCIPQTCFYIFNFYK